ncbi:MAG: hypothetical protein EP343_12035 [Deltaproteobacteria bacterium]|nr:MAG: hypothetical protein EP343_12035 [Deltaproteobacteria bacterium]
MLKRKPCFLLLLACCLTLVGLNFWGACSEPSPIQEPTSEVTPTDASVEIAVESVPESKAEVVQPERLPELRPELPVEQGTPDSVTSVLQVCASIARSTCPAFFACCSSYKLKYSSVEDCIQQLTTSCDTLAYKKERQALADGKVALSQEQLGLCLKALEETKSSCLLVSTIVTKRSCEGIFQDPAKVGENCNSELGGLHCGGNTGVCFPEPTGFSCKKWSPAGTACAEGPCEPGLFCDVSSSTAGVCKALSSEGQPCRAPAHCQEGLACLNEVCSKPLDGGKACDNVRQCKAGFACSLSQKLCVPTKKPGESCEFALHCGPDHVCLGLAATTVCQKGKSEGETCAQHFECAVGLQCVQQKCAQLPKEGETCASQGCNVGLTCDRTNNTCVKLPTQGQACLSAKPKCAADLVCIQGSCQPPGQNGAACGDDEECEPGRLGCGSGGKCEPLPTLGQPCFRDVLCERSVVCDLQSKRCVERKKEGELCPFGFECELSLSCVTQADQSKKCVALPKEGERCSTSCSTGLQCRPGVLPGKCIPAICNGTLQ